MMTKQDAEFIGEFVADMIRTANNETGYTYAFLTERLARQVAGVQGSGACICRWSPEQAKAHCVRVFEEFETYTGTMKLDHRCAWHGAEAQTKLWGRHKTLELEVTSLQWSSLGVEYPTP